jgi:YfiH family protein
MRPLMQPLMQPQMYWVERDGVRWLEASLGEARVAFSARSGGVSEAPFDSLNLGLMTEDRRTAVLENRGRLAGALGFDPGGALVGLQVHGARLAVHDAPPARSGYLDPAPDPVEADGQVARAPGLAAVVLVADCLPVALAGPGGVAMLHCGWRGLAAGIVARGAEAVGATSAVVGPGIGPCCYEVGGEVIAALGETGQAAAVAAKDAGAEPRWMLDLPAIARGLLAVAGIGQIAVAGHCTSCEPELFFSHRRDAGRTGRQAGVAWLPA